MAPSLDEFPRNAWGFFFCGTLTFERDDVKPLKCFQRTRCWNWEMTFHAGGFERHLAAGTSKSHRGDSPPDLPSAKVADGLISSWNKRNVIKEESNATQLFLFFWGGGIRRKASDGAINQLRLAEGEVGPLLLPVINWMGGGGVVAIGMANEPLKRRLIRWAPESSGGAARLRPPFKFLTQLWSHRLVC